MEIELNLDGWFAVMLQDKCAGIFPTEQKAEWFASLRNNLDKTRNHSYKVIPITRKIDFTFEQIQAELCKRVDKVQAVCFENPKL